MASRASSRTLTDHEEIRRWAEERGARPSAVRRTENDGDPGVIRLDFPGFSGEGSLEEIEWDEWFEKFDESNLALIVQDQTAGGQKSNFNKIVSRDAAQGRARVGRRSRSSSRGGNRGSSRSSRAAATARAKSSGSSSRKSSSSRSSSRKSQSKSQGTTAKKRVASHKGGKSGGRYAA